MATKPRVDSQKELNFLENPEFEEFTRKLRGTVVKEESSNGITTAYIFGTEKPKTDPSSNGHAS